VTTPSIRSPSARSAATHTELLLAHPRQVFDEQARVAARVSDVANGPGDLSLDRLEDRIEPGDRARVEDFLLLAALGEERHLLRPRLELGRVAIEIERAARDGMVFDGLGARELVQERLAVLAEPQLDQRVSPGPLRGALAQEAQTPRVEPEVGCEPHTDGRFGAAQGLPEHARRTRRGPRERVAGRDDPRVAASGLEPERVLFLDDRDLVTGPGQEVGRRDADDAAAEDQGFHASSK
jgi:hypothetical protein